MKKLLLLLLPLLAALLLVSCEDTTEPEPVGKGSLQITSTPSGAQIFLDNAATGKITPATITDLVPKSYNVTLKLAGYRDTTVSVTVTANFETPKFIQMTQNPPVLQTYSGIKLYEKQSNSLSGLDLSAGTRVSSTSADADIYYEGTVSSQEIVRSQHLRTNPAPTTLRTTYFNNATGTTLTDGTDSPTYQSGSSSWVFEKAASNNYSFLYDEDDFYSKLKIVQTGQDGPFDKWVVIDYINNKTANDPRF